MEVRQLRHSFSYGDSAKLVEILDALSAVAVTPRPVLITSRRGTGPLLLAETIHRASARPRDKFVIVRCGLCPPATVDLKLFGSQRLRHGNSRRLPGKILAADGGTLFVEQVQNASPEAQRALLQIIDDHEITMGAATRAIDIRIIVSAPDILEKLAAEGRFRVDLFYRLNAMPISVPLALATREAILGVLASVREHGSAAADTASAVSSADAGHPLPQPAVQVRRLAEAVRRAAASLGGEEPPDELLRRTLKELRPAVPAAMARRQLEAALVHAASQAISNRAAFGPGIYDLLLVEAQRALIRRAVAECNGILDRAAALLGLTLHDLETLMGNLGLTHASLNFA